MTNLKDKAIEVSTKTGYRVIKIGGVLKYEHRAVIEDFIGRKLNKGEDVHHKNGNRLDNRIENLEIVSTSIHRSNHAKSRGLGKDRLGISPTNKLSKKLIKRIAVLRNKYKKSLNQIAKIVGISYPTVQKYCVELKINNIGLTRWSNH